MNKSKTTTHSIVEAISLLKEIRLISGLSYRKHNIKVKPHYYYGYLQGFKVFINGKKFPLKNGCVYAHNKNKKAIKTALNEYLFELEGFKK